MTYVPVILGTARVGRRSESVANYVLSEVVKAGISSEIVDVRDYRIEATDNTRKSQTALKLAEKVTKADALIIVSPEYNYGYPGELKMMLDLLTSEYARKPVGICGVSNGSFGGVRMIQQLRPVLISLQMVPIKEAVHFPKVQDLFDEKGAVKDAAYEGRVRKFLDELLWYAKHLKAD
ncbi:NADPH-dependent FMN reductase [uncultured archaeon]|nr:NADPH-dependent FMN reductase [uncultured archaeon]